LDTLGRYQPGEKKCTEARKNRQGCRLARGADSEHGGSSAGAARAGARKNPAGRVCCAHQATGRRQRDASRGIVAGITTEICVTFPVLQMLEEGYEVQVSADASASWSKYGNELALRRMEKAGAVITTVDQIISELAVDWTSPNGQKLEAILDYS
jgi:hypothetical protein